MHLSIVELVSNICKDVKPACQGNKKQNAKHGKLPPTKMVVLKPWEMLCVDHIGPYTLRGVDGIEIDFMCLTMIDPASSWFEIVELPVATIASLSQQGKNIALRPIQKLKMHSLISHLQ